MKYNLGNLCLGHGIICNSCGSEYIKLISYGRQNNIKVFEKCPNIPATANVIPDQ